MLELQIKLLLDGVEKGAWRLCQDNPPPPPPCGPLTPAQLLQPLAWYRCGDAHDLVLPDSSGHAYHGTLGDNRGSSWVPTLLAKGLQFAGGQVVGLPSTAVEGVQTVLAFGSWAPTTADQAVLAVQSGPNPVWKLNAGDARPVLESFTTAPYFGALTPLNSCACGIGWRADGKAYLDGCNAGAYWQVAATPPPLPSPPTSAYVAYLGKWPAYVGGLVGELYTVLLYDRLLTDAEIGTVHGLVAGELAGRGIALAADTTRKPTTIFCVGDSIMAGMAPLIRPQITTPATWYNLAIGGQGTLSLQQQAANNIAGPLAGYTGNSVVLVMTGTNDGFSSDAIDRLTQVCQTYKTAGAEKVIVCTGLPRYPGNTGLESDRQTWNDRVRYMLSPPWDAVADWGHDPYMGQFDQELNETYYFSDRTHPNLAGSAIGAAYAKAALNAVGVS
jgi:hypothetical protein